MVPKNWTSASRAIPAITLIAFTAGIVWIFIYFGSEGLGPISTWGGYNAIAGISLVVTGGMISTRWRE
ncbi:cell division protein CrgA [Streptomyces sp. NPDC059985]|uniref:cell division protein CrgA n=1 Tax=Streptomyces sp. NPDC059985 TaxID=3347025 RepID=UPI0036CFF6BC